MDQDERYRNIVLEPIYVCAKYKPKMGQGRSGGFELEAFQNSIVQTLSIVGSGLIIH